MSLSTNFPTVNPTLNLNFLNAGVLDSRITFSRGSTATYFDQLGVLQTAQNNIPRFDYNPSTLAAQGLLIEEARTNSIRNNTMQGAVAGTPGTVPTNWAITTTSNGLTRTISMGTENGITYIDVRYAGTTTAASFCIIRPEAINQVAAASGQSWTSSVYMRVAAGSTANITAFENWVIGADAGGTTTESTQVTPAITGTMTRFTASRTMNNASTAFVYPYVAFTFNNAVAIDITLRIGLPQLEQGAFATSVIPTTTTALTRNADVASMTGTNFSSWFNASEGTVFVYSIPSNVTASNFANWAIGDSTLAFGAANTIYNLYTSGLTGRIGVNAITAGASQVSNLTPSYTQNANTPTKSAIAYKLNDYAHSVNGVAPATDTSATVPTVTSMSIGGLQSGWSGATNYLNGYIQRISYYPVRLSNTTLQALTT
jgi:hypothetical protein